MLGQRLAGDPGVHGVELWIPVRQFYSPWRQQLPAGELQLVVVHVADVRHVVANQVVEVALVLPGLVQLLRAEHQLDPPDVFLQSFLEEKKQTKNVFLG